MPAYPLFLSAKAWQKARDARSFSQNNPCASSRGVSVFSTELFDERARAREERKGREGGRGERKGHMSERVKYLAPHFASAELWRALAFEGVG